MGCLAGAGGAGLPRLVVAAGLRGAAASSALVGAHCVGGTGVAVLGLGAMGSVCRGGPCSAGREKKERGGGHIWGGQRGARAPLAPQLWGWAEPPPPHACEWVPPLPESLPVGPPLPVPGGSPPTPPSCLTCEEAGVGKEASLHGGHDGGAVRGGRAPREVRQGQAGWVGGGGQPPGRHAAGEGPMQREGGRVSGESGAEGLGGGVSHAKWDGGWRQSEGQGRGRITGHGGVAAATEAPSQALGRRLLPRERRRGCGESGKQGAGGGVSVPRPWHSDTPPPPTQGLSTLTHRAGRPGRPAAGVAVAGGHQAAAAPRARRGPPWRGRVARPAGGQRGPGGHQRRWRAGAGPLVAAGAAAAAAAAEGAGSAAGGHASPRTSAAPCGRPDGPPAAAAAGIPAGGGTRRGRGAVSRGC